MATAEEAISMLKEVLGLLRASGDPVPASTGMAYSRVEELRMEADRIESRDEIIKRARKMVRDHAANG
jgi:hypothetical protein